MKNALLLGILALVVAGFLFSKQFLKTNQVVNQPIGSTTSETDGKNKEVKVNFSLEVRSPKDKTTVSSSIIKVEGKTGPGAEIFVNEKETKADLLGNFSVDYELFEGENNIYITANDNLGNYAEKTITVYLESTK